MGVALDPSGDRLYVKTHFSNELVVVDAHRLRALTRVALHSPVATLKNPQDFVKWGFGVWESDKKSRTNAESIKKALADNDVKGAIDKVVAAAGGGLLWGAVVTAASALGNTLLDIVARNGDDDMFHAGGGGPEPAFFHAHDPGESETHEGPYARVRYAVHLYK